MPSINAIHEFPHRRESYPVNSATDP